jgi:hypothetical protein
MSTTSAENCPVCLEPMTGEVIRCTNGHALCIDCFATWITSQIDNHSRPSCTVCRAPMSEQVVGLPPDLHPCYRNPEGGRYDNPHGPHMIGPDGFPVGSSRTSSRSGRQSRTPGLANNQQRRSGPFDWLTSLGRNNTSTPRSSHGQSRAHSGQSQAGSSTHSHQSRTGSHSHGGQSRSESHSHSGQSGNGNTNHSHTMTTALAVNVQHPSPPYSLAAVFRIGAPPFGFPSGVLVPNIGGFIAWDFDQGRGVCLTEEDFERGKREHPDCSALWTWNLADMCWERVPVDLIQVPVNSW